MTDLFKKIFVTAGIIIFFGALIFYGYMQLQDLAGGPVLKNINTDDAQMMKSGHFILEGLVKNTVKLELNGRPIYITEDGVFKEHIALLSGYNNVGIYLEDRFGREKSYDFPIFTQEDENTTSEIMTSGADEIKTADETEITADENTDNIDEIIQE